MVDLVMFPLLVPGDLAVTMDIYVRWNRARPPLLIIVFILFIELIPFYPFVKPPVIYFNKFI